MDQSLNVILYGPPGTGKTHAVTRLALERLLGEKPQMPSSVAAWKESSKRFSDAQRGGQIEFTTFHQNYAYEDFVEGLRAQISGNDGEKGAQGSVSYSIEPGVLKRIADRAMYAWLKGVAPSQLELSNDERQVIDEWFRSGARPEAKGSNTSKPPNYVLIIDEINRGNIARIFGELITLVEESKRARNLDELESGQQPLVVTLPYSKQPFILPPNLYIIGTMNTADRSLIGLDAALRRRFDFIEMRPKTELLETFGKGDDIVDLSKFLTGLNERIAEVDTPEHEIGHAYLMNIDSMPDLGKAMRTKVLPQLREYFHQRPDDLAYVLRLSKEANGASGVQGKQGQAGEVDWDKAQTYQGFYRQ